LRSSHVYSAGHSSSNSFKLSKYFIVLSHLVNLSFNLMKKGRHNIPQLTCLILDMFTSFPSLGSEPGIFLFIFIYFFSLYYWAEQNYPSSYLNYSLDHLPSPCLVASFYKFKIVLGGWWNDNWIKSLSTFFIEKL
jgi:hypothetical protein